MEILQIGSVLRTNSEGYLIKRVHIEKITSPWLEAINDLKISYIKNFGEIIHSIYVRGSVARGEAVQSISDIDTITVLLQPLNQSENKLLEKIHINLEEKYSFATAITPDFIQYSQVMGDWENNGVAFNYAFTIKVQSVCIYGPDLSCLLPQFKPNTYTAIRLLSDLNAVFNTVKNNINSSQDPATVQAWCRWVMKIIIRNAFIIVMKEEGVFTRDLFVCCQIFLKYFPQQEIYIQQALEYAINPIANSEEIINLLNIFGTWLQTQINKQFLSSN